MLTNLVIALRRMALAMLICAVVLPVAAVDRKTYVLAVIPSAPPVSMHVK